MIPYVAAAYEQQGFSGEYLLDMTFQDVERFVTPVEFLVLTRGRYRDAIYQDAEALQQQLPFYKPRFIYVTLINAVGQLLESMSFATVLISAFFGALVVFIAGLMVLGLSSPVAFYSVPPAVAIMGATSLARFSTPDALAACSAAAAFFFIYKHRTLPAMVLIAFLPLIRTDFIVLSLALSAYLFVQGTRVTALAFALSLLGYYFTNQYAGNYGHLVIFNFTLIYGPQAYPADMPVSQDVWDYVRAYYGGSRRFLESNTFFFAVPVLVFLASHWDCSKGLGAIRWLFLISLFFMGAHFALFPAAFSRTYFLFVWSGIILLAHMYELQRST